MAFDPIGVWRFLKVPGRAAASGYNVVVAAEGADLDLTPGSAAAIVRAAMHENISLVLDLYSIELSKRDWKAIVEACVRLLLYENKPHGLRHIFLEEAAEFVPQRIGPDQGSVYAEIEKLARMGGNAGLGYTLINQRAEEINKAVLELCDCLFLHRQKGRNSLVALAKWLDVADARNRKEVIASLPMLGQGKCWIWSQGALQPVLVTVPAKRSFHPDRRNPSVVVFKAAADVSGFVQRLNHALQLAARPSQKPSHNKETTSPKIAQIEARMAQLEQENVKLRAELADTKQKLCVWKALLQKVVNLGADIQKVLLAGTAERLVPVTSSRTHDPKRPQPASPPTAGGTLPKAERTILAVLGRHDQEARPKTAVAIEAGYAASGGGYNNALSRLRAQGLIQGTNSLKLTESGREYVERNGKENLPTGSALAQYWMRQLPRAERAILTVLTEPPRRTRSKAELGIQTGYEPSGGGFNNALSRLRTLLLIEGKTDLVASDRLFD